MNKIVLSAALAAALVAGLLVQSVTAQTAATPAPAAVTDKKDKSKTSSATAAMRERQKKCGAEWKEAKVAGKVEKGTKWPQYWSACNKRLKEADAKKS
jgi:uncharacterized low-complexity protein